MHTQLTFIVAQEQVADLLRAADHDRLVHTAATTTATTSHAVPTTRHAATAPVSFLRWLRRRLA